MEETELEALATGLAGKAVEYKREIQRLQAIIDNASACSCDPDVGHVCENHYPEWAARKIEQLEAENVALRARAVPEVVWPEGRIYVDMGELRLVARPDGEWWVEITTENDTEEVVSGHEASLELAQSACKAAFLRFVGVQ